MCGIAGLAAGESDEHALPRMLDAIRYRGPDDSGIWEGSGWRIGMTRLAIIDLKRGRQPMRSRDTRWTLVLNGEIYNFLHVKEELETSGVAFRTHSDTEVLLELIAMRGVVRALERVEGMFALAAVDSASGDLWLARDRFGEKPLYVDRRGGTFGFCSELTPLVAGRPLDAKPSARGLTSILRYGHPWPGLTAVEGIGELEPASWIRRSRAGEESGGRYWLPPDRVDVEAGSLQRCAQTLLDLLDRSVRDRLIADVPLGLFLSGGIDSGAVATAAVRTRSDIRAVTVGFQDHEYDERSLARLTASHAGISIEEEGTALAPFTPRRFDELLSHYGQPFADTSAVPTRAVAHAARRHFKVVLSGDGGDELLAGYLAHRRNARLERWGAGAIGGTVAAWLGALFPDHGAGERVARGLELIASFDKGLLSHTMAGVFTDRMIEELVSGTTWAGPAHDHLEHARREAQQLWFSVPDKQLALSLHQIRHSLPQDILAKVDRMSMAESLEVRAPFLDSRLASYALSLPSSRKERGGGGKYVLREALKSRLPAAVLGAPKRGFALPVRAWLGEAFWSALRAECERYCGDSGAELNTSVLSRRVEVDTARARRANDYRAIHRAFLLYGFFRWRNYLATRWAGTSATLWGAA